MNGIYAFVLTAEQKGDDYYGKIYLMVDNVTRVQRNQANAHESNVTLTNSLYLKRGQQVHARFRCRLHNLNNALTTSFEGRLVQKIP